MGRSSDVQDDQAINLGQQMPEIAESVVSKDEEEDDFNIRAPQSLASFALAMSYD